MSAIDNKGDEKYWVDGETYDGVRLESASSGEEKYFIDGQTDSTVTPLQNVDTGKFFLLFE